MACKYKSRVWDNGWCNVACMYCTLTQETNCKHNKRTNADRIRAMSDKELGIFLAEWAEKPWAWKQDGEGECLAWLQEACKGR